MAKTKKPTAKAGGKPAIDLSDADHLPDGSIRPEVQARVDAEQRELMAQRKRERATAEKAERANYAGKLERAAAQQKKRADLEDAVKAMSVILADHEKRLQAGKL